MEVLGIPCLADESRRKQKHRQIDTLLMDYRMELAFLDTGLFTSRASCIHELIPSHGLQDGACIVGNQPPHFQSILLVLFACQINCQHDHLFMMQKSKHQKIMACLLSLEKTC